MNERIEDLTPAQQTLAQHLLDGGRVYRSKEALEGRGYFAQGIKMILPATVQKLMDLNLMVLSEETEEEEVYTAPEEEQAQPLPKPAEISEPEPTESKPARYYKEKAAKRRAEEQGQDSSPTDILMWVGYQHYPTIQDFIDEASTIGISKRISRLPIDIVPGKTRLFFAHDEGQKDDGVIFGYSVIGSIEVLDLDPDQPLPPLGRDDVQYLDADDLEGEDERGCGFRNEHGAMYLVTYDQHEIELLTGPASVTLHGTTIAVFDQPVDYESAMGEEPQRFRSYKRVDGDALLDGVSNGDIETRPSPTARRIEQIREDMPSALVQHQFGQRWTDETRAALQDYVKQVGSRAQAFRNVALVTGVTAEGIAYQWYRHIQPNQEGA